MQTILALMLTFTVVTQVGEPAQQKTKIAVMPLTAKRVPTATAEILDDLLINEIGRKSEMEVIGAQDINAILGLDKMKDVLGCNDVSCAVQIGGALGVDFLLTGSVSTLGGEVIVSLTLIDTKQSKAKARAQVRTTDDEHFYAYAIAASVAQLFGLPAPAPPAEKKTDTVTQPPGGVALGTPHKMGRSQPETLPAASPEPGTLRFKTTINSLTVAVRSTVDGKLRACPVPVSENKPCVIDEIPSGLATLEIEDGSRKIEKQFSVQAGNRDQRFLINKTSNVGGYIAGAAISLVGLAGGALLLNYGVNLNFADLKNQDTGRQILLLFSGFFVLSGGILDLALALIDNTYFIDSSTNGTLYADRLTAPTVLPSKHAPLVSKVGFGIVPLPGGLNAAAFLRF